MLKKLFKAYFGEKTARKIRLLLREIFQRTQAFYFRNKYVTSNGVVLAIENHDIFYGYYDKSPASPDNSLILAIANKPGQATSFYGVWFKNGGKWYFRTLGETQAWNYQMGSRLQWVNGCSGFAMTNVYHDGTLCSKIFDVRTGDKISYLEYPVFEQSPCGNFFITLDFFRLEKVRKGYGYNFASHDSRYDCNGGLYYFTKDSKMRLLISPIECSKVLNVDEGGYLNHPLISPNGRFMIFLYILEEIERKTYLLCHDFQSGEIFIINEEGFVSHYNWSGDFEFIVYCTSDGIKGLYKYSLDTMLKVSYGRICNSKIDQDCHPSYVSSQDSILCDTYPNSAGYQSLSLVPISEKQEVKQISYEYLPAFYNGPNRCDLHPRLSHSEDWVIIDTIVGPSRAMKIFSI